MEVKKNPNVDPKRNSTLYFQIGLAAVLLLTYVGIELKSEDPRAEKVEDNQQTQQQETKSADSYGDEGSTGEDIPDEVPFAVIEQVPLFPGCENEPKSRQFDCFQEQMQKHIKKNFTYPERAMEDGTQGRVQVEYIIGTDGKVVVQRVKGPKGGELLEKEARRIIEKLPTLKPGKQRNKAVKVRHVVPITFKLQ